jgi:peptidoglycan/LPS O-acetylase OafA/YrhL
MSPERTIGAVVLFLGLASLGVLAWASRTTGNYFVLTVVAVFGMGCVLLGGHLLRIPASSGPTARRAPAAPSPRRVRLSHACSTAGVLLLIACVAVPEHWYPVALLLTGIALLAVAHVLTPCEGRLEKLRKARAQTRL